MQFPKRLLPLLAVLVLTGCASKGDAPPTQPGGADPPGTTVTQQNSGADPSQEQSGLPASPGASEGTTGESTAPSGGGGDPAFPSYDPTQPYTPTSPPATTEPLPDAVILEGLRFDSFGRYSGAFVEDGSDRPVENVACVLAVNTTDRYLDLATAVFEIDGVEARFTVTGLPPGKAAWILEGNALQVESGASFVLKGGATSYSVLEEDAAVTAAPDVGTLLVTNNGAKDFSGYIYYKALYTDGNFLGGITYRSFVEQLPAQSRTEITAGHCTPDSAVVRIMYAESTG